MTPPIATTSSGGGRSVAWLNVGNEGYGVRRAVLTLTLALRRQGWRTPMIALTDGPFVRDCLALDYDVHVLGQGVPPSLFGSVFRKAAQYARTVAFARCVRRAVGDCLRDLAPDACHFLLPNLVGIGGWAARFAGVPSFWEMPNAVDPSYPLRLNRRIYQSLCRRYDITVLANSRYTAESMGERPVKPTVFHLGCDPEQFDPAKVMPFTREFLGVPQNAVLLGIVGRITPSKGQDRVLRGMLAADAADAPLHLLLAGGLDETAYVESLRAIARESRAEERLHMIGPIDAPERCYGAMDIAINSRVDPEPFGLSVIEAMMMGTPALVHALGGPAETVIDGVTGWHVPDPSPAAFERGLRRALSDKPRWPEMRAAARSHALDHFTAVRVAQRYMGIVEARLGRSRAELTAE